MVVKRSLFKMQKQSTKNYEVQNYGYGAINQNVPKSDEMFQSFQ